MRGVEHVYPYFRLLFLSFALIGVSPAWAGTRDRFHVDVTVSGVDVAASDIDTAASNVDVAIPDIDMAADDIDMAAVDVDDVNDPIESVNRFIFGFNEFVYDILLRPISKAYNYLPQPVREAVSNILDNVSSPKILANDVLQGEGERALQTTGRFLINSTAGLAGLFDVAEMIGIPEHDEDFGQTLGVWGVGEGFYLVLPLFGPSSPRDAVGKLGVDYFFDPLGLWLANTDRDEIAWALVGARAVDEFAGLVDELDQIKKTSIDYYAAIRSMYRQKREAEIKNGEDVDLPPIPDLDLSFQFDEDDQLSSGVEDKPN